MLTKCNKVGKGAISILHMPRDGVNTFYMGACMHRRISHDFCLPAVTSVPKECNLLLLHYVLTERQTSQVH